MNYFDHPYCSNSTLTALGQELGILHEIAGDSYEAFRMGTLFDAVVTEPEKLDLIKWRILDTEYSFTKEEYTTCLKMKRELEENELYLSYTACGPDYQKEVYQKDFDFGDFKLNMRGKLDYYIPGTVADLKSTAATSQRAFENAIEQFGYHRQMWLYCQLTKASRAILFGVSKKKPHKVFTFIIKKGDKHWEQGEKEIKKLAFKYYMTTF